MELCNKEKTPYFGSVRFFRHIILGFVGVLIAVPIILIVVFALGYFTPSALAAQPQDTQEIGQEGSINLDIDIPLVSTMNFLGVDALNQVTVETPFWQNLYPELYAQAWERNGIYQEKTVYLTFDDGPSARTPEILEILHKYNIKATFFVQGKTDEQSKQWMRDIVQDGHTIGMHSFTHDYKKIYASPQAFLEDWNQIYQLIYETTGVYPQIMRFPGGSINGYNSAIYTDLISEVVRRGFVYFDWNVAIGDAAKGGTVPVDTLVNNALKKVSSLRRAVVLMHDNQSKNTTVEALPEIIEGYQNAGFTFAALTPEVVPVVYTYPN